MGLGKLAGDFFAFPSGKTEAHLSPPNCYNTDSQDRPFAENARLNMEGMCPCKKYYLVPFQILILK